MTDIAELLGDTAGSRAVVAGVSTLIVVACVILHYEALNVFSRLMRIMHLAPRLRVMVLIFAILAIHVSEIWIFGFGYWGLSSTPGHGALIANHPIGLLDHVYFSATCYTTLGLGDIAPLGAIRFLTGTEALTGFVLVTWSASFTFVEMQRFWRA
ncbi:MAG: ion channel [Steroidobacteraceae bacterium]